MNLPKPQQEAVARIIQAGVRRCAECLSNICRAEWNIETTAVGAESEPYFETLLTSVSHDHLGSYLSLPTGSGFLLVFDSKSGLRVSTRFIGDFSEKASMLDKLELQAVNEISNILINLLVDTLASACRETLILPAPAPFIDTQRDLLINAVKRSKNTGEPALSCYSHLSCKSLSADCTLAVFLDEKLTGNLLEAKNKI